MYFFLSRIKLSDKKLPFMLFKGTFFSECSELENLNFGDFKAVLASQGQPSCPFKPLSCQTPTILNF